MLDKCECGHDKHQLDIGGWVGGGHTKEGCLATNCPCLNWYAADGSHIRHSSFELSTNQRTSAIKDERQERKRVKNSVNFL